MIAASPRVRATAFSRMCSPRSTATTRARRWSNCLVAMPVPAPTSRTVNPSSGPRALYTPAGYAGRPLSYSLATASSAGTVRIVPTPSYRAHRRSSVRPRRHCPIGAYSGALEPVILGHRQAASYDQDPAVWGGASRRLRPTFGDTRAPPLRHRATLTGAAREARGPETIDSRPTRVAVAPL